MMARSPKNTLYRRNFSWFSLILGTLLTISTVSPAANGKDKQPDKQFPYFKYSETASEPVIEYNLVHDMIAEPDPEPLLRVYGDGRVHVHYPAYMQKAGDYQLKLTQGQLNVLIRELANDGVIDFDRHKARHLRERLETERRNKNRELFHYSDDSHTVISIRLDEYQKSATTGKSTNIRKQFSWPNLKQDARRFPESQALKEASRAADRLEDLIIRQDLVKVR
jgi:hypothetical protein